MRITFTIFMLLIASLLQAQRGTDVLVGERTFDYGTINQGEQVEHTFSLTNKTGKVLEVLKEACPPYQNMTWKLNGRSIENGQILEVKITWHSNNFCGDQQPALVLNLTKFADGVGGSDYSQVILRLKGTVHFDSKKHQGSRIVYDRKVIDFGNVPMGTPLVHRVKYVNLGTGPAYLRPPSHYPSFILDRPDSFIHAGDTGSILFAFQQDWRVGEWSYVLVLESGTCQPKDSLVFKANFVTDAPLGGEPVLLVHQSVIDLDTVFAETQEFYITFENTGNAPLIFSNCKTSCGCMVAECPRQPILPGECGSIRVKFDAKGRRGPNSKSITLNSNANPSSVVVRMKAFILEGRSKHETVSVADLEYSTKAIDFGKVAYGETVTREIKVKNRSNQKIRFTRTSRFDAQEKLFNYGDNQPALTFENTLFPSCKQVGKIRMELAPGEEGTFVLTYTNQFGGRAKVEEILKINGNGETLIQIPFQAIHTDKTQQRTQTTYDQYGFKSREIFYKNGVPTEGFTYWKGEKIHSHFRYDKGRLVWSKHYSFAAQGNIRYVVYDYDPETGKKINTDYVY